MRCPHAARRIRQLQGLKVPLSQGATFENDQVWGSSDGLRTGSKKSPPMLCVLPLVMGCPECPYPCATSLPTLPPFRSLRLQL